ncbi:hypothetical protein [Streptomyces monomycini]|uniref:hypothetical protein n=1 Tax=Streptomyces monomycini TaxID=371720 RepID=UPI001EEAB85D|nr:hypothetical protein [Streptomyces monomycini]
MLLAIVILRISASRPSDQAACVGRITAAIPFDLSRFRAIWSAELVALVACLGERRVPS